MSKARIATESAKGQGGCLPREVDEIFFRCLTRTAGCHILSEAGTRGSQRSRTAQGCMRELELAWRFVDWTAGKGRKPLRRCRWTGSPALKGSLRWRSRRPVMTWSTISSCASSCSSTVETCTLTILPAEHSHPTARKWSRCQTMRAKLEASLLLAARRAGFLAEEECVQMLRDLVEAKQNLIDPGFSLYSDPIFKRERGKYVGFIELLRTRHLISFRDFGGEKEYRPSLCGRNGGRR